MSSFNKPFRGLPTEIRLIIWEYVAFSPIEVIESSQITFEAPTTTQYPPGSVHDQVIKSELTFKPPLQHLTATTSINQATRQELTPLMSKHGLSLRTKSASPAMFRALTEQFKAVHAPRIKRLEVYGSARLQRFNEAELSLMYGSPVNIRGNLTSPIPVDQVHFSITGQQLWATAFDIACLQRNRDWIDFSDPTNKIILHSTISRHLIGQFRGASGLLSKRWAQTVVYNIIDLGEVQKSVLLNMSSEWNSHLGVLGACVAPFDPLLPGLTVSHELSKPVMYRYQIKIGEQSGAM